MKLTYAVSQIFSMLALFPKMCLKTFSSTSILFATVMWCNKLQIPILTKFINNHMTVEHFSYVQVNMTFCMMVCYCSENL